MKDLSVGDKVRMMWPKQRPMMCVVGYVESMEMSDDGMDVAVRFANDKPPVKVLVDQAKVWSASNKAECGYWMRCPGPGKVSKP